MGPKPFTPLKLNDNETFDKVFSVPIAPGNHTNGVHSSHVGETPPPLEGKPSPTEESPLILPDDVKITSPEPITEDESNYIPRTPSTAERRKIFEVRSNSKDNENDDTDNNDHNVIFERASIQRSSIAERRKMYENRSLSVQETTSTISEKGDASPVMMRRKESIKKKNLDQSKDEQNRSNVSITRQVSSDGSKTIETPVAVPVPKRTSTVFGNFCKLVICMNHRAHEESDFQVVCQNFAT